MDLLECKMDKRNSQCEREQPLKQKHLNITEQTLLYSFYGHSHLSVAYADVTKHRSRACVKALWKFIVGEALR